MTGRPERSEAAEYYFTYIDQVKGDDALAAMREQLEAWPKRLAAVSEEQSLQRYAEGKWSIRELVNHVTDTERAFAFRALWFARGFDTPLPSYDQTIAAAGAAAGRVPWAAHIQEFKEVRQASISLYANMPAEGWARGGVASGNFVTVRALAFMLPGHVAHHARILEERYLVG